MTGIMFARVHARAVRAFARLFTSVDSIAGKPLACALALVLSCALVPSAAFADDAQVGSASVSDEKAESVAAPLAGRGYESDAQSSSPNSDLSSVAEGFTLASALSVTAASIVSADVMLGADETVVGSFTVDGLTFAIASEGVALVSVAGPFMGPEGNVDARSASQTSVILSGGTEGAGVEGSLSIPQTISYEGVAYSVTSIAPYAFYLSGATDVVLPASVVDVDERAFRSSDVASVEVTEGNPAYASYDGVLYNADLTSLLLIPEGRSQGVRIPYTAEEVPAGAFSHASGVGAISVDADSPTYSSEDGLLYNADGTVLLRVPAGAVDIVIRDGCTTIAAGAMEGCAKLERINAPASVVAISPDVFESVPTVGLPAMTLQDESVAASLVGAESASADNSADAEDEAEVSPRRVGSSSQGLSEPLALPDLGSTSASSSANGQLSAMVALAAIDDGLPEVDVAAIKAACQGDDGPWRRAGFSIEQTLATEPAADVESAASFAAAAYWTVAPNKAEAGYVTVTSTNIPGVVTGTKLSSRPIMTNNGTVTVTGSQNGTWSWSLSGSSQYANGTVGAYPGYTYKGWSTSASGTPQVTFSKTYSGSTVYQYAIFSPNPYAIALDANGSNATVQPASVATVYDAVTDLPTPARPGYRFLGWDTDQAGTGSRYEASASKLTTTSGATVPLYAQWEPVDFDVSFDTSSEPGDENYLGDAKPDETVNVDDGQVEIEDPKRPGYVFQGWTIPDVATDEGSGAKEALDQDLVYQGDDGKWYVDASKLPDYATDGKVELTARWTSIISVDVPSAVTFYADVVTQGNESREGAVSGAFGQNMIANQSQVDLRVVGLESEAVETTDATLGADSILKKAAAATPATSASKLLSLYPSAKAWTAEELQDPSAVGGTKASTAVDFDLDDLLLEASFAADDFTIPAGDTLNMGYRLNLTETGRELDYDKLSTLEDGQSAAIANVSYCFAADYGMPFWTINDDGSTLNEFAIKADAERIAAGDTATIAKYTRWMQQDHRFYIKWYDQGVSEAENPMAATIYGVRIIGINHDDRSDGTGKAGLTFQFVNCLEKPYMMNYPTCGTLTHYARYEVPSAVPAYDTWDNVMSGASRIHNTVKGGWGASLLHARMNPGVQAGLDANAANNGRDDDAIWQQLPMLLANEGMIVPVEKSYWNNQYNVSGVQLLKSSDRLFVLSYSEVTSKDPLSTMIPSLPDGACYAFYAFNNTSGASGASNPTLLKKSANGSDAWRWWLRTTRTNSDDYEDVSPEGNPGGGRPASALIGVSPAFCF